MRILTTALILVASGSFAHAGEIVTTTTSQQSATQPVVQTQPTEQAAPKAAPQSEPKAKALGKVGREGCGDSAQAKAPLLTN